MESSECKGQCRFCLDQIPTRDVRISNEDMKMYKDVFDSVKMYLNEDEGVNRISFDWNNSCGLLSPFCQNCFQSAEIIHGVRKQLEEIQENLNILANKFKQDVKLRASKNGAEEFNINLVKMENEDTIKEENDVIFDEVDDGYPFLTSEEELKFSENMLSNIYWSDDDGQFSSADDAQESKIITTISSSNQWPRVVLERLQLDKDGKNKKRNSTVISAMDQYKISAATSILQKATKSLDGSRGLCNDYGPAYERNSSPAIASEVTSYQSVYLVTKNESGDFLCDICGKPFKAENWLLTHRPSHNGEHEKPFKCSTCDKSFNSRTLLKRHVVFHLDKSHECYSCEKLFKNEGDLNRHLRTHDGHSVVKNAFQCSFCKINFNNSSSLKLHASLHEVEQFQCNSCNERFESKEHLGHHMLQEHGKERKCNTCGRLCKDEESLKRHVFRAHKIKKSFECEICGHNFKQNNILRKHVQVVHDKIFNFMCTTCGKCFGAKSALKKHEETHEDLSERKKFKCEICEDKYFINIGNLNFHLKQFHTVFTHGYTGENYFVCESCGKTYTNIGHFEIHLRTHTGERPFSCKVCGLGFAAKQILKNHLLTHSGEKPHKCTFCEKYFRQSHQLKTHLRIHTGERPYSCSVCARTFSDRSTWYKHGKRHK